MTIAKASIEAIRALVTSEKRLVYVPTRGNLGDAVSAHATYCFLRDCGITFSIGRTSDDFSDACLLIGGGGNLVEGRYSDLSEFLKRCGARNRTVVLPHTIVGNADMWRALRPSVHVFTRERTSYQFLADLGLSTEQLQLTDDMAFSLAGRLPPVTAPTPGSCLVCFRQDSEARRSGSPGGANVDIPALMLHDWIDPDVSRAATEWFFAMIGRHERIVTDRLHVAIVGYLLGRDVTLLPNAYFKNRAVYECSLAHARHVRFLDADAPSLTTDVRVGSS